MAKKKPTGFVAVCQCGFAIGALDLERSERGDVSRLLGKWLMEGCVVHPQFTHTWAARLEPCKCDQQPNTELGNWRSMTAVEKLRQQVEIRGTRSPFGAVAAAALEEIEAALPAMREYARKNPKHHFSTDGTEQDPNGAHAWLERNDKPNTISTNTNP